MNFVSKNWKGILLCFCIALPSWILGRQFPIVGGPVIAILAGMVLTLLIVQEILNVSVKDQHSSSCSVGKQKMKLN